MDINDKYAIEMVTDLAAVLAIVEVIQLQPTDDLETRTSDLLAFMDEELENRIGLNGQELLVHILEKYGF